MREFLRGGAGGARGRRHLCGAGDRAHPRGGGAGERRDVGRQRRVVRSQPAGMVAHPTQRPAPGRAGRCVDWRWRCSGRVRGGGAPQPARRAAARNRPRSRWRRLRTGPARHASRACWPVLRRGYFGRAGIRQAQLDPRRTAGVYQRLGATLSVIGPLRRRVDGPPDRQRPRLVATDRTSRGAISVSSTLRNRSSIPMRSAANPGSAARFRSSNGSFCRSYNSTSSSAPGAK